MDRVSDKNRPRGKLYPPIRPYSQQMLDVGDGHMVYLEESGNPQGIPVVVFHGGPGGGSSPTMRRFFDPEAYRIVLFDQRGCGNSLPHAVVRDNTTWHLIQDIVYIRETLGIDRWIVFGGSWGATLALVYAQTHPRAVAYLALRGVFLATRAELEWFYGGGAGRFFPELWENFTRLIPEEEQGDMIKAYHKRLFSKDKTEQSLYAKAWAGWENALASIDNPARPIDMPGDYALAFAKIENHYFTHGAFLDRDGQILDDMFRIAHIPGTIVQGRFDMICPPTAAHSLHRRWPSSELRMVHKAGHALSEPGIAAELVQLMDKLKRQRETLGL